MKPKKAGKLTKCELADTVAKLCKAQFAKEIEKKAKASEIPKDDLAKMILAAKAFMGSLDRARMDLDGLPRDLIHMSMCHLYRGRPLVFASKGNDFIICDPRTYAQMVGNTG